MAWHDYNLDQMAQKLVLDAKERDPKSLNQSFKMREAVAYGLERFWGEHLRLQAREESKSRYWKATWDILVNTMTRAGVTIPNDPVRVDDSTAVKTMARKLWGELAVDNRGTKLTLEDRQLALAVLTQLCDSIVWWTQRYKGTTNLTNDEDN
jgi:hypothetical protein